MRISTHRAELKSTKNVGEALPDKQWLTLLQVRHCLSEF